MHECKHEAELGAVEEGIKNIRADLKDIKHRLLGNGQKGLVTRVELLEQAEASRPSHKAMVAFSACGGGMTVMGALILKWVLGG